MKERGEICITPRLADEKVRFSSDSFPQDAVSQPFAALIVCVDSRDVEGMQTVISCWLFCLKNLAPQRR